MKTIRNILAVLLAASPLGAIAQDSLALGLKADFVSQYIWRGTKQGHISVQPELSVGWKGLSLTA